MRKVEYIGDGVTLKLINGMLELSTPRDFGTRSIEDKIYLDLEMLQNIIDFAKQYGFEPK